MSHDALLDVGHAVLSKKGKGSVMSFHQSARSDTADHELRLRVNRERREDMASTVPIPNNDFVSAAGEKTFDGCVHFARERLLQLRIEFNLLLAADPGNSFGISNNQNALLPLRA